MTFKLNAAARLNLTVTEAAAPKKEVKLAPVKKEKPAKWKPNIPAVKSK